jgi:hypothetical protein
VLLGLTRKASRMLEDLDHLILQSNRHVVHAGHGFLLNSGNMIPS